MTNKSASDGTTYSRRYFIQGTSALVAAPAILHSSKASAAPVTFKLGHSGSQEWQGNLWARNFADALAHKVSDSKVEIYPNAQLGQDPALAQAVKISP
jgi:TRAP-type C4-dicarboxylate transport system substrate-binding protein